MQDTMLVVEVLEVVEHGWTSHLHADVFFSYSLNTGCFWWIWWICRVQQMETFTYVAGEQQNVHALPCIIPWWRHFRIMCISTRLHGTDQEDRLQQSMFQTWVFSLKMYIHQRLEVQPADKSNLTQRLQYCCTSSNISLGYESGVELHQVPDWVLDPQTSPITGKHFGSWWCFWGSVVNLELFMNISIENT